MNLKTLGNALKITSGFITALWVVGLIVGNIYLVALAIVMLIIIIPVVYAKRDKLDEMFKGKDDLIIEDERTRLIYEKASNMALGISLAIIIYAGVVIVALRNSYPQFTLVGYTLFAVTALFLVIYFLSTVYYKRKY
ncbi:MAG: DUF2178 domain-containing protein [Euryarchaeota archaeon]|jgi:uncharacterized membrane protein|uniref:DUF2178 domain-containing protein n=1 Tax=Methanobacterium sp. MZD130B TaxID=3394378 RepID=UPI00175E9776|nr:DUF2178 domain-containing protein [Euryarchaeota archaeon]HHT19388.1 DUF2178 domain-containing protein [Methanobacterium sp.]